MSYVTEIRPVANAPQASRPRQLLARLRSPGLATHPLNLAATRVSESLEAGVLVATLFGVSLVMSTIAAGAF